MSQVHFSTRFWRHKHNFLTFPPPCSWISRAHAASENWVSIPCEMWDSAEDFFFFFAFVGTRKPQAWLKTCLELSLVQRMWGFGVTELCSFKHHSESSTATKIKIWISKFSLKLIGHLLKPQVLVSPFLCFALSSEQFLNAGEKNQLQLFQTLGNDDPCVAWEGFGENPGADLSEIAIFIPFLSSQHSRDFFFVLSAKHNLYG